MIFAGDRDRVELYLRQLADLMGLRDWVVRLEDGVPDDDDAFACVQTYTRIREALIFVRDGWEHASPETFRLYMVHELIHTHLEAMEVPLSGLELMVGKLAYDVAYGAYREAEEVAVHAIARAWAPLLPLPEETTEEAA